MEEQETFALLVIDVQQGLFEHAKPIYQAEQMLANINTLVRRAHQQQAPVLYIQHSNQGFLKRDTPHWQLHSQLQPTAEDIHIYKEHGNAFQETSLHDELQARRVDTLIVTGLVSHGCVAATAKGGIQNGYRVIVASDAHSNYNASPKKLIQKTHDQLLALGVVLQTTQEILG